MSRGTRPRRRRIEVWCTEEEYAEIKAQADATCLSASEFLRRLGRRFEPKSVFDKDAIHELAKLHADQCRLGDLLNVVLSERGINHGSSESVRALLQEIRLLQGTIAQLVVKEARRL